MKYLTTTNLCKNMMLPVESHCFKVSHDMFSPDFDFVGLRLSKQEKEFCTIAKIILTQQHLFQQANQAK